MAILKIARMGHPVLRRMAAPVADPTGPETKRLVSDMVETMLDAPGIGLAAPQVHRSDRVIVFRVLERREDAEEAEIRALINPEITPAGGEVGSAVEGCLSMPGLRGLVPRYARIRVRGTDPAGRQVDEEMAGLTARVVQHEVDHLDGVLFLERMTDIRQLVFESELRHVLGEASGGGSR